MSMKFYRNIKTGETGYIDVKEPVHYDTEVKNSGGFGYAAQYKFSNFALHAVIAGITGILAASILDSTVLCVIIGIISFVISTIIHLAKEGDLFDSCSRKDTVIKQIRNYVLTIGIAVGVAAIVNAIFGIGIATIVALIELVAVIIIIKKTDENRATL